MKKICIAIATMTLIMFLSSCPEILDPEANGRWNPIDPSYDSGTDPDVAGVPIITFESETDDATPVKSVEWVWAAGIDGCVFRYAIDESETTLDLSSREFSDATTASITSGDGIRYIHVQAKTDDGTLGPIATAGALLDNTAPAAVTGLTADAGAEQVGLSWVNPSSDFAGVEVRYGTGDYPAAVIDGLSAYEGTGSSLTHTGLEGDVTYYYSVFVYDEAENYSEAVHVSATPVPRVFAYIADGTGGLAVIEVTDPENPGEAVSRSMNITPIRVDADETYAYLVSSEQDGATSGLALVNVTSPMSPGTPVYATDSDNYDLRDVAVVGNYAYHACVGYRMIVYDISDPAHISSAYTPSTYISGNVYGIAVSGTWAYLASGSTDIASVDITSSTTFAIGSDTYTDYLDLTNVTDICVSGNYAYLIDADKLYLVVCDLSTPGSPGSIYVAGTTGIPYGVTVSGNFAYVAAGNYLDIFNISDPTSPIKSGSVDTSITTYDVAVYGNYAFVANGQAGMTIIDVTNPGLASIAATVDTSGTAQGIVVK